MPFLWCLPSNAITSVKKRSSGLVTMIVTGKGHRFQGDVQILPNTLELLQQLLTVTE